MPSAEARSGRAARGKTQLALRVAPVLALAQSLRQGVLLSATDAAFSQSTVVVDRCRKPILIGHYIRPHERRVNHGWLKGRNRTARAAIERELAFFRKHRKRM